ncbi:MAG: fumarylacetoacetate hydrolase family protein [Deltaproteobacteria bacterium]|nr:fumarylacetoacetate hydrolase family protein [Deltaproteobacteria bacterium]
MKLVTFTQGGTTRIGVLDGDAIVDLAAAAPQLPREMCALLAAGAEALETARQALGGASSRVAIKDVRLEAPILRPPKILAVGLNYKDHIAETGNKTPEVPMIFNKQSTAINSPTGDIYLPRVSEQLDYEGEFAVVIGRYCRHVPKNRAREVIAGYTIANDVSVRDWQRRVPTFTMGKSWDTHCPLGPYITTADEVGDPHTLDIKTWVNGELRQSSNTSQLLFNCFDLVEHLTTAFTLEPGDIISTGTPGGVAAAMKPPKWLKPGDVVKIAIDKLGEIENRVIAEPEGTARI